MAADTVPLSEYRDVRKRAVDALDQLNAIKMFAPGNLVALIDHLDKIFAQLDTRLGTLECRLDAADVKELPDGVPDDECERYFTLPVLSDLEVPE